MTRKTIMVDLDGTLAKWPPYQVKWNKEDPEREPIWSTIRFVNDMSKLGFNIVVCTARPANNEVMEQTISWLDKYSIKADLLIMRDSDNWGRPIDFKLSSLDELQQNKFDIVMALEDDPEIVKAIRAKGIFVIDCGAIEQ